MTKRRERRVSAGSDRLNRIEPVVASAQTGGSSSHLHIPRLFLFFFLFFLPFTSFIVYRIKYGQNTNKDTLSVYERGLVKPKISFQEILAENSKASENTSLQNFPYPVLAYVTPWNSKGYDVAKQFTSKFTHLSPVWYELKSEGSKLILEGRHNVDIGWISELRMNGNALVVPRVVIEAFPVDLLKKKHQWDEAIDLILRECKDMGYDGIVLESWSRWAAYGVLHDPDLRNVALHFIEQLGQVLHSVSSKKNSDSHLQLIYVIPAPRSENLQNHDFGPQDFQRLSNAVDGFSLMTYDFSGPYSPGPNAPLNWIESSLRLTIGTTDGARKLAHKIFIGLNFYGNDFVLSEGGGVEAITGRDYLSLLENHRPVLQWKENIAEHYFIYSVNQIQHVVFYPSLMSISLRLNKAQAWGAGISIWEIGQGLDYFFELF
ncbi:glycosyl hydrolase superfamily protein [Tasmannia lanceolata]|uniref:glycosyl hydrolase superfamily protein n=1 Tax=Tasmannia lanceolata TaxID=3420 RepID=UPI004062818E